VAGLAGGSLHALPDFSVEDDAAADAGAEGECEERVDGTGFAGTEHKFAVGGEVGIGVDVDGAVNAALEFGAEVEAVEAGQIRRVVEDAGGQFKRAGRADSDAEKLS
jgi:hypothetical protein